MVTLVPPVHRFPQFIPADVLYVSQIDLCFHLSLLQPIVSPDMGWCFDCAPEDQNQFQNELPCEMLEFATISFGRHLPKSSLLTIVSV